MLSPQSWLRACRIEVLAGGATIYFIRAQAPKRRSLQQGQRQPGHTVPGRAKPPRRVQLTPGVRIAKNDPPRTPDRHAVHRKNLLPVAPRLDSQ
ncbi:hypothetical protein D9M73_257980 [compost metagenome]